MYPHGVTLCHLKSFEKPTPVASIQRGIPDVLLMFNMTFYRIYPSYSWNIKVLNWNLTNAKPVRAMELNE